MKPLEFPREFVPLRELKICSNVLLENTQLAEMGDYSPLTVGAGRVPRIWLQVKEPRKKQPIVFVENSFSRHPQLKVILDESSGTTLITMANIVVLFAKATSMSTCVIDLIDLRPLGLDIHGNPNELFMAGSQVINSSFTAQFAFGFTKA